MLIVALCVAIVLALGWLGVSGMRQTSRPRVASKVTATAASSTPDASSTTEPSETNAGTEAPTADAPPLLAPSPTRSPKIALSLKGQASSDPANPASQSSPSAARGGAPAANKGAADEPAADEPAADEPAADEPAAAPTTATPPTSAKPSAPKIVDVAPPRISSQASVETSGPTASAPGRPAAAPAPARPSTDPAPAAVAAIPDARVVPLMAPAAQGTEATAVPLVEKRPLSTSIDAPSSRAVLFGVAHVEQRDGKLEVWAYACNLTTRTYDVSATRLPLAGANGQLFDPLAASPRKLSLGASELLYLRPSYRLTERMASGRRPLELQLRVDGYGVIRTPLKEGETNLGLFDTLPTDIREMLTDELRANPRFQWENR